MKKINSIPIVSILVGVVGLILIGQYLFCHGMFIDGVVYSTLSRNFALENPNNFWDFGMHKYNPFFSHPPLAFWLQAILFKVFGDHFWIDRLYSILCLMFSLYLIRKLWQQLVPSFSQGAYWVQLIYLVLPLVHWSYNNNMLENTSNCFTLLSIWCYVVLYQRQQHRYGIAAGLAVLAATLTKGPVGLFPIVFPLFYYFFSRKTALKLVLGGLFIPIAVIGGSWAMLLLTSANAQAYFSSYLHIQLYRSLTGDYGDANHFLVLEKLASQLLVLIGIGAGLRLLLRKKVSNETYYAKGWLFLLIGLSSSLPIMISPKQMNFYLLPSLIFFVFTFVFFHVKQFEQVHQILEEKKYIRYAGICAILLFSGITIHSYGNVYRDHDVFKDAFLVGEIIPKRVTMKGSDSLAQDWGFYNYLARYYHINIHFSNIKATYYINKKNEPKPKWYKLIPSEVKEYNLYKQQ